MPSSSLFSAMSVAEALVLLLPGTSHSKCFSSAINVLIFSKGLDVCFATLDSYWYLTIGLFGELKHVSWS